jgi:4-hydroxy-4-methyl-2-oxoglutarate aldolase
MTHRLAALALALLPELLFAAPRETPHPMTTQELSAAFRLVEVASVADAMEQLLHERRYLPSAFRPLAPSKFAGPAVTVQMNREENKEGAHAIQGALDAIDGAADGSVYVMVLENGLDFAGIGGLMTTAMKSRGFVGAVVDGGVRDLPQIQKLQFPVFSRSIVPSTTIGHYRFAVANGAVTCGGIHIEPNDIIVADLDGVAVVPRSRAEDVLRKAQELDFQEHSMIPYIEQYHSINKAVEKFGRI